jgi:hypothetical protein
MFWVGAQEYRRSWPEVATGSYRCASMTHPPDAGREPGTSGTSYTSHPVG